MRQVRPTKVIAHRRSRASRVHVRRTAPRCHVVQIHRAKINAEARLSRIIRHARMHLCGRKQQHATGGRNHSDLWIQLHRLFRLRLFPRVLLDELAGILPARAVPFRVVVFRGAVAHRLTPIPWMKRHRVFWNDRINRQPPVDLAHRRGVPRVAVRVERVCNSRRQEVIARGRTHPRHVKVRLFKAKSEITQHSLDEFLRFRRMNKSRFQLGKNRRVLLYRQIKLRRFRIKRMKRRFHHLPCKVRQCQ